MLNAQPVITEIQRDPQGGETAMPGGASHEFVEIVNFGTDTLRLDSVFLTDGVESDAVLPWPGTLPEHGDCAINTAHLAPGQCGLILDPDYAATLTASPDSRLPIASGTVLLRVEDGDLGNGLASDDGVLLYRGSKSTVTAALWCAGDAAFSGTDPVADKIVLTGPARMKEGFSLIPVSFLSVRPVYGACSDSLTPGTFELLKSSIVAEIRFGEPAASDEVPCTLACIKAGALLQTPVEWEITRSRGASERLATAKGILSVTGNRGSAACLLPLDSCAYTLTVHENGSSPSWPIDLSTFWTPPHPLRINELFARGNAGEPEWFEIVNHSSMPVNLRNWTFGNGEDEDTLTSADCTIQQGAFLVVTANAALFATRYPAKNSILAPVRWHTLDNYNDTLRLRDASGRIKEQVCYRSAWFPDWKAQTLARTSLDADGMGPESWSLAGNATPGQPNGITTAPRPGLTIGPLPFSPDGDGNNDDLLISLELPGGSSATITVYGFSGTRLRDLGPWTGRPLRWDGRAGNGAPAPLGPFFVVAQVISPSGKTTLRKKGVLWR